MGPGERNYHEQVDPITRDKRADIIPRSALRRQQIKLDNALAAAPYRAPQQRSSGSFAQLTPVHADQQTFIYTVPANRKFNLDLIALALTRDTAAGGTLSVLLRILFTPSGGSQQMLASLTHVNAALDTNRSFTSAGKIILLPGDVIEGRSQDLNAAGTHTRMVVFHGTEFDA